MVLFEVGTLTASSWRWIGSYGSSLMVTPFAFQKAMNLNLWCKAEVSDANRNFIAGRF
jgi:nitric oxide reductase large subunit